MKRVGLIVLVFSLIAAFFITSAIMISLSTPETPSPPESQLSILPTTVITQGSTFGEIFAFAIVIIILIIVAWWVYHEHGGNWSDIVKNNAILTFLGLIVLNAIAYILHYESWRIFYDTGRLFWMTNIGVILFVYLIFEKSKAAKVVATALALLILTALVQKTTIFRHKNDSMSILSQTPTTNLSDVPAELALREICMCESGCQQFEPGTNIPLQNKGIPGKVKQSGAFGKYQFLESHRKPARDKGFDLNTEAGQDGYARYRYERFGTKDWEFDQQYGGGLACWGPKLANLKVEQGAYSLVVNAPAAPLRQEVTVPLGFDVTWGESEDSFTIVNDRGLLARYNRNEGIFENLPRPSKRLEFQSLLGNKVAIVKLRFKKN